MTRINETRQVDSLILGGNGAEMFALLARMGLGVVEDVAERINYSSPPPVVCEAALGILVEARHLKRALGSWFHGEPCNMQSEIESFRAAFLKLEKCGWSVGRILEEAARCNPKIRLDKRGSRLWLIYNRDTGKRDKSRDAGWTDCGLPLPREWRGA